MALRNIDIAQQARMRPILEVARDRLGIPEESLEPYGRYKAKVSLDYVGQLADRPDGKLVLVTAISPTPAGEGKTTTTVGLGDALNLIGRKTVICLREPALGPVFGMKGGAAGGGYSQVVPHGRYQPAFHPATSPRSHSPTICSPRWSTTTSITAIPWDSTCAGSPSGACSMSMTVRCVRPSRAWAARQMASAPGRLRHRGGLGSDGDLLPGHQPGGSAGTLGDDRGGLHGGAKADPGARPESPRRDDGPVEECVRSQPRADAGEQSGLHPWRAVCQHRAWLQLGDGDTHGFEGSPTMWSPKRASVRTWVAEKFVDIKCRKAHLKPAARSSSQRCVP